MGTVPSSQLIGRNVTSSLQTLSAIEHLRLRAPTSAEDQRWADLSVFHLCHSQRYGSEGLKLVSHEETVSFGQAVLKLTFDPGSPDDGLLTAECRLDHPFFVRNKGRIIHVVIHPM